MGAESKLVLEAYKKYGYPSPEKLFLLLNKQVRLSDIKEKLATEPVRQLYFSKKTHIGGHILAWGPLDQIQIDICFLDKFGKQNGGYNYILLAIDVFSRYAWGVPIKSKSTHDVLNAFKTFPKAHCIMSDNGTEFLNKTFTKYINDENIAQQTALVNDHHALGIIDRFTLTLKNMIYKTFIANDDVNWKDHLTELLHAYNNTPHSGIYNYTPQEAFTKTKVQKVLSTVNVELQKDNKIHDDVRPGESVRLRVPASKFKRGFLQKWESDIVPVESVTGNKVIIDGKRHKLNDVLLVPNNTNIVGEALRVATKVHKSKRALQKEDIGGHNKPGLKEVAVREKRERVLKMDTSLIGRRIDRGNGETGRITKYDPDGPYHWYVKYDKKAKNDFELMDAAEVKKYIV